MSTLPRPILRRQQLVPLAAASALVLILSGLLPEPAHADWVGDIVDGTVRKIFGVQGDWITGTFVQWLIKIPDVGLTSDGGPARVYRTSRDIAFATLGAVLTLSIIHYWASGLTAQAGGAGLALDGVLRTAGAALMILAWPFLLDNGVTLAHVASDILVPGAQLDAIAGVIVGGTALAGVFRGGVPLLIGIIVMIAFALIILIIFVTKVMLGAALIALASGMPLALALWPIPATSWLASTAMRWCVGIVVVQLAWAVELGVYARVPEDFFLWQGAGAFVDKLIKPLTMIALLLVMLSTAKSILSAAGLPNSGGGVIAQAVPHMVGQLAFNGLRGRLTASFSSLMSLASQGRPGSADGGGDSGRGGTGGGGPPSPGSGSGPPKPSAKGGPPTPRSVNGGSPTPAPTKAGSPEPSTEPGRDGGSATPPPTIGGDGLPTRTGHPEAHRQVQNMIERMRSDGRPRSADDVGSALNTIQGSGLDARAAVDYLRTHGGDDGRIIGRMADASIAPGISSQAADAFRTIGIAQPRTRAAGIELWTSQAAPTTSRAAPTNGPTGGPKS